MIAIIDYGMGNLRSVLNAFRKCNGEAEIVYEAQKLNLAKKIVLPGVGAFKDTMDGIETRGFKQALLKAIDSGIPYLGICMGQQILFDESEEGGRYKGLGILKGKVKKFKPKKGLKVPHMGWNQVKFAKKGQAGLFKAIPDDSYFYFDHSYYVAPKDMSIVSGTTDYGLDFVSMVSKDNISAVQFHPEKSQDVGLQMIRNFIGI